jgi:endonuclease G, mitochondrial
MTRSFAPLIVLLIPLSACAQQTQPGPKAQESQPVARASEVGDVHLALGNPSAAKHEPQNPDRTNFLMVKDQYALSYNDKKGTPNWVSYRLERKDMGRAARSLIFFPDETLPAAFHKVMPGDYYYTKTAMTRGHMCPSGHRNNTEANAKSTYVMTNMVPQTEELNGGSWELLERHCRDLCFDHGKELFIVCGPHGMGGVGAHGQIDTVGHEHVVVPKSCWKVILVVDGGGTRGPLARVNAQTRAIAVVMPNTREPNENVPWERYVVSIADVEALTGYRFFDRVPAEILNVLKKKVDGR